MGATANAQGAAETTVGTAGGVVGSGNSLEMVQGVSGDSDSLAKAAKAIAATPNALATTSRQHQADSDRIRYIARFNVDFTGGVSNDPIWVPDYNRLYGRLRYSLERVEKSVTIAAGAEFSMRWRPSDEAWRHTRT